MHQRTVGYAKLVMHGCGSGVPIPHHLYVVRNATSEETVTHDRESFSLLHWQYLYDEMSQKKRKNSVESVCPDCESLAYYRYRLSPQVIVHTDEAMSWETVRSLDRMPPLVLIIRNLCIQGGAPEEVMENLEYISGILRETLEKFPK